MENNFFGSGLTPISGQSAPEAIARRLSEAITTGELKAGEKLPREDELARALGVAPMTLRNALASLRDLGLLVTTRGRFGGTSVPMDIGERLLNAAKARTMSLGELRSLIDWRRAISGEACFFAAERGTESDFAAIRAAANEFAEHTADLPARRMADARLHTLIADASKSPHLLRQEIQIQEQLNTVIRLTRDPPLVKETLAMRHEPIVDAIVKRDAAGARRELIAHVESSFDWLATELTAGPR
ncbi:FadR/GntR family transcriptional regulator [Paraburkholderia sp. CNPSo 3281]|uniref:FadR/GntR family transcriptional regulator n=1 Tax=Paraburkholderia sp. CNPSo 3281 TaxID=2940933 RepID=UPI0020B71BD9|nr:FCD domain-containing protein [Paraburkholderia sp. CNPSo 3281]MCP3721000.1 FCD domain-containing protein [Paraburkholderia sp. CNPSo 3281]